MEELLRFLGVIPAQQ